MTTPQHTPGPWTLVNEGMRWCVKTDPTHVYAFRSDDEANARLIAAAPEMLDIIRELADAAPGEAPSVGQRWRLRSVLAKSTGRLPT